jgi:hypothetical protein
VELERQLVDLVLENRGHEIKNVRIKSEPDFIGWDNLGKDNEKSPRSTTEHFKHPLPYLSQNERLQFFWCDMEANIEVLNKPFQIILEFDNRRKSLDDKVHMSDLDPFQPRRITKPCS